MDKCIKSFDGKHSLLKVNLVYKSKPFNAYMCKNCKNFVKLKHTSETIDKISDFMKELNFCISKAQAVGVRKDTIILELRTVEWRLTQTEFTEKKRN